MSYWHYGTIQQKKAKFRRDKIVDILRFVAMIFLFIFIIVMSTAGVVYAIKAMTEA